MSLEGDILSFSKSKTCPATGNTVVATLTVNGNYDILSMTVSTVTNGTDGFLIELKMHRDSPWISYLSGTDFDTASDDMLFASATGPHELSAAGAAIVVVNIRKAWAVRISASGTAGADTAVVTVQGLLTPGGL
jgi:hypothetical protein